MVFIRYKQFGKLEYAYEIESYWDKKSKTPKQRTKYLGVVVDKKRQIFEKKNEKKHPVEKQILDYGDTFLLNKYLKESGFVDLIDSVFGERNKVILSLVLYRIISSSAMQYAETWHDGNYIKHLYKDVNLSSQRISEYFCEFGTENLQRKYFGEYIKRFTKSKQGIIIDGTSLPNQIHIPLTRWGLNDDNIEKQVRFLLAIDKDTGSPLFFRLLSGNIVDVSALKNTIVELQNFGVKESFLFMDAGFFSEDNIKDLYHEKIDFITRLPSGRRLYKDLVKNNIDIDSLKHAVKQGKRGLCVKQVEIELYGKKTYAHIVLDPNRRGKERSKMLLAFSGENNTDVETQYDFLNTGIMILVSSFSIPKEEVVSTYYMRQVAETYFSFSKDDLKIIPLRAHTEETLRGFLFIQFLSLIAFSLIKKKLGKKYCVEEIVLNMRNLKCKVFDDYILVSEVNKNQKEILKHFNYMVPNKAGI